MKWRTTTRPTPVEEAFARAKRERLLEERMVPGAEVLNDMDDEEHRFLIKNTDGIVVDGERYANCDAAWRLATGDKRPSIGFSFIYQYPEIRLVMYRNWKLYCVADVRDAWLEHKNNIKPRFSRFRNPAATPLKTVW